MTMGDNLITAAQPLQHLDPSGSTPANLDFAFFHPVVCAHDEYELLLTKGLQGEDLAAPLRTYGRLLVRTSQWRCCLYAWLVVYER